MAAAADFSIKAHDRLPVLPATFKDGLTGTVIDITTANSVKFIMRAADDNWTPLVGTPKISSPATVANAAGGQVTYDWAAVDTDTPGKYVGEFEVIWSNLKKQTFPTRTYITIEILADLDGA